MGQCGSGCNTECQTCQTQTVGNDIVADELGQLLVPLNVDTNVAKMTFTRVEFANGNDKAILNLDEFSLRGLSLTGTFTLDERKAGISHDCRGRMDNCCLGPRQRATNGAKEWGIRIMADIDNCPESLTVEVVDVDLVKCSFKMHAIIPEEQACKIIGRKLAEVINSKILKQEKADLLQQLIVVDDEHYEASHLPSQTAESPDFSSASLLQHLPGMKAGRGYLRNVGTTAQKKHLPHDQAGTGPQDSQEVSHGLLTPVSESATRVEIRHSSIAPS